MRLKTVRVADDEFFHTLVGSDGQNLSVMILRHLPNRLVWPVWRQNLGGARGVHTQLQERVVAGLPGFSMVSAPHEMSDAALWFRLRYMRKHPDFSWTLDRGLDSSPYGTPRLSRGVVDTALAGCYS